MKKVKLGKTYKLFVLPILICFFAFNTFPLINAVVYSLTDSRGFGDFNWVGFQNYFDMFKDSRILNSYLFTFKFANNSNNRSKCDQYLPCGFVKFKN